jgi:1-aminocyclopropane-1-carboxylate deaminase
MLNEELILPANVRVDPVPFLSKFHTTVDVLRLDLVHPVISGNKWYKLKEYVREAKVLDKKIILTFGGAYSNHIVAAAATAKQTGFKSIGIIRGEKPNPLSHTLLNASSNGMDLYFISRENYKRKLIPAGVLEHYNKNDIYLINEGGYGVPGVAGAKEILSQVDSLSYTHIIDSVGTGTTLAGLIEASREDQKIIGISSMKNNYSLQNEIEQLLSPQNKKTFILFHDYSFGGYAKFSKPLIDFMNEWFKLTGIPSDFVYTGKLFFAVNDLLEKNYFSPNSKLLIVHSGGLLGNQSLPNGTLIF